MATERMNDKPKKPRGPRRLEYIPENLRGIAGVEHLTTLRQLKRLQEYCSQEPTLRPPFVRLGASVYSRRLRKRGGRSSATYAVDVKGVVSVVRRFGDPRRVHAWMSMARRPWNQSFDECCAFIPHLANQRVVRVVTLASLCADHPPEWVGDKTPEALRPDGESIRRVWACATKRDVGGADREFVVEGHGEWWKGRDIPDLVGIREAQRTVVCAEDATLWLGPLGVLAIPHYSFADLRLMEHRGEVIEHLGDFIVGELRKLVASHVNTRLAMAAATCADERLCDGLKQALATLHPFTVTQSEVRGVAEGLAREIIAEQEVHA